MREVIVGLSIRKTHTLDPEVLLVCKKGVWITPGGKVEGKERPYDTLFREFRQELPEARITAATQPWPKHFRGISPHLQQRIRITVIMVDVYGRLGPAAEIQEARYIPFSELATYTLSVETRRIIAYWQKQYRRAPS